MTAALPFPCDACKLVINVGEEFVRTWLGEEKRWIHKHPNCPDIDAIFDDYDIQYLHEMGACL